MVGSDGDGRIGDVGFRWSACGQLPMGGSALIYAHEHAINNKCRPSLLISQKISASLQQSSTRPKHNKPTPRRARTLLLARSHCQHPLGLDLLIARPVGLIIHASKIPICFALRLNMLAVVDDDSQ